jgi:hypothetical protein
MLQERAAAEALAGNEDKAKVLRRLERAEADWTEWRRLIDAEVCPIHGHHTILIRTIRFQPVFPNNLNK